MSMLVRSAVPVVSAIFALFQAGRRNCAAAAPCGNLVADPARHA